MSGSSLNGARVSSECSGRAGRPIDRSVQQGRSDETKASVGKMPTTSVCRFDLAIEALDGVDLLELGAVLLPERHSAEHIELRFVHDRGELGQLRPHLVCDRAPPTAF
jgi:hypothetical protein